MLVPRRGLGAYFMFFRLRAVISPAEMDRNLAFSTIKADAAAISSYHKDFGDRTVFNHPLMKWFLRGVRRSRPVSHPLSPPWDLSLVRPALVEAPFELLAQAPLEFLSFKTDLLLALMSAKRKVDFANNVQLSLTLAALSIGLWWTFDRSRSGFGLGISIALLATLTTQILVYNGVFQYTNPDFLYIRSWLPCIYFSGVITMGNIGRQLALYEYKFLQEKTHLD